jgi:hypothetical protein
LPNKKQYQKYYSSVEQKHKKNVYSKEWNRKNRDKINAKQRARYKNITIEEKKCNNEYQRNYYRKNREKLCKRIYVRYMEKLMNKYNIDREEAMIVHGCRCRLYKMSPPLVLKLRDEMYATEGEKFTEMVMDGIPQRKEEKLNELENGQNI